MRSRGYDLLLFVLVAALLWRTPQAAVQALPTATGPGGHVSVGAFASGFESDYGKRRIGGYGAFADYSPTWRMGVEAEYRTLHFHEEAQVSQTTYLAGPKIGLSSRALSPYVKVLGGLGVFHFPYRYADGHYFVLAPGAGLEWRLGDGRARLRLIDFEYQEWPQFTYGNLHPYGISAGISIRLWKSETKRSR